MHDTASLIGRDFLSLYRGSGRRLIVEVGSYDVNGSLRPEASPEDVYLGVDFVHGPGVDIVVQVDAPLPLRDQFADIVISSSQMEHDPCFWVTFLEMCRITRPGGHVYLNAPSNGTFHRYPQDVWRFYPDAGRALERWARKNGHPMTLVESFVAQRRGDVWNDFVAVFCRGTPHPEQALLCDRTASTNVTTFRSDELERISFPSEDMSLITALRKRVQELEHRLAELEASALAASTGGDDPAEGAIPQVVLMSE